MPCGRALGAGPGLHRRSQEGGAHDTAREDGHGGAQPDLAAEKAESGRPDEEGDVADDGHGTDPGRLVRAGLPGRRERERQAERCAQSPRQYGGSGQDGVVGNDDDEQAERTGEGTGAYDDGAAEAVEEEGAGEAAQLIAAAKPA